MEINVLIEEGLEGCLEVSWLESIAQKILIAAGVDSRAEFGLVIVGQERIHQLNLSYLGEDEPTDVLAFSMLPQPSQENYPPFVTPPDGLQHLGEVIIAYPQAVIQAEEHQHSIKREIAILLIHGVLHLLGSEHDNPEQEHKMQTQELEILSKIEERLK